MRRVPEGAVGVNDPRGLLLTASLLFQKGLLASEQLQRQSVLSRLDEVSGRPLQLLQVVRQQPSLRRRLHQLHICFPEVVHAHCGRAQQLRRFVSQAGHRVGVFQSGRR